MATRGVAEASKQTMAGSCRNYSSDNTSAASQSRHPRHVYHNAQDRRATCCNSNSSSSNRYNSSSYNSSSSSSSAKPSKRSNFSAQYKRSIAADQRWTCGQCSSMLDEHYEIDHVLALADGGSNSRVNLWALCLTCHKDKTAEENDKRFQLAHSCNKCSVVPFIRAQWRVRGTPTSLSTQNSGLSSLSGICSYEKASWFSPDPFF